LLETVETLRTRAFMRVEVTFAAPPAADAFAGLGGIRELRRQGASVLFAVEGPVDPLVKALALHRVLTIEAREADLEDVFLSLYRLEDAPHVG
jgi:ABC-2 type transport system ATP-binding protein